MNKRVLNGARPCFKTGNEVSMGQEITRWAKGWEGCPDSNPSRCHSQELLDDIDNHESAIKLMSIDHFKNRHHTKVCSIMRFTTEDLVSRLFSTLGPTISQSCSIHGYTRSEYTFKVIWRGVCLGYCEVNVEETLYQLIASHLSGYREQIQHLLG